MNACKLIGLRAHCVERIELRLVDIHAARTSKRRNVDRCRTGFYEGLRCGTSGSTGRKNVIDQQDVFVADRGGTRNLEVAANIMPALARRQACLAFRRAKAHEGARRKRQMPRRMRLLQRIEGVLCQGMSLVESALAMLGAMERHRNDEHLGGRFRQELCDCCGEHVSKAVGCRMHAVAFKCVNRRAHAAVVSAE